MEGDNKYRPGCFKKREDGQVGCGRAGCPLRLVCLNSDVGRRGPLVADRLPGRTMEGGVVQR